MGDNRVWSPLEAAAKEVGVHPRKEWHPWLSAARELRGDLEGAARVCSGLERYLIQIQGRFFKKLETPEHTLEPLSKNFRSRLKKATKVLRKEPESRGFEHWARLAVLLCRRGRSTRSLTPPAAWRSLEAGTLRARLDSDWGCKRLSRFSLRPDQLAVEIARLLEDGAVADGLLLTRLGEFPQFRYFIYRWYDLGAEPEDPEASYKAWVDSRGGEGLTVRVMQHLSEEAYEKAFNELAARRGPVSDLLRARCCVAVNRENEALWLLETLEEEHPNWMEIRACRAHCLSSSEQFEEADRELKAALRKRPDNVYFRHQRYQLLLQMGKCRGARRERANLERLRPDLEDVVGNLDSFERPILGPAGVPLS